jgi:hypothetical protein
MGQESEYGVRFTTTPVANLTLWRHMQKENILTEIRRAAQENGGKPLGKGRFGRATRIRGYDWQKFWPRNGQWLTK